VNLLENKIVLITKNDSTTTVTDFKDIAKAKTIVVGDPASVPAGQYAKAALDKLGVWDAANAPGKMSLAGNVVEALQQVATGSAEVGIVYATDAAGEPNVRVIEALPDGTLDKPIIYPIAVTAKTTHREAADALVDFLRSDESTSVFEKAGWTPAPATN
jgi:molybdate transport system substrate-binding protein